MLVAAKLGLCFTASLFAYLVWQGLPASDGPRACHMEDAAGHRTDFRLTDQPHSIVVDLGRGAIFVFPKNEEMSDETMEVAAIGTPGGDSTSVILETATGKYQQTFLSPGRAPEFFYGECEK